MAISLLHPTQNNATPLPERMLYHLSLDRAFAYVCTDARKRECFLSVSGFLHLIYIKIFPSLRLKP